MHAINIKSVSFIKWRRDSKFIERIKLVHTNAGLRGPAPEVNTQSSLSSKADCFGYVILDLEFNSTHIKKLFQDTYLRERKEKTFLSVYH